MVEPDSPARADRRARGEAKSLEMEDGGGQHTVCAGLQRFGQVGQTTRPPEAITGMLTARDTAWSSGRSYPARFRHGPWT